MKYEIYNDTNITFLGLQNKCFKVLLCSIIRIYGKMINNVIPVIPSGSWIKRQDPDTGYAKTCYIIKFFSDPNKITNSVSKKSRNHSIKYCIFIPRIKLKYITLHDRQLLKVAHSLLDGNQGGYV